LKLLARIRKGTELAAIMRTMIATLAVTMAIVDGTLGSCVRVQVVRHADTAGSVEVAEGLKLCPGQVVRHADTAGSVEVDLRD
jgi:hypothetical protein